MHKRNINSYYNKTTPNLLIVEFESFFKGYELDFLIDIGITLLAGVIIGAERELKGKPAGISTHTLVIGGAMIFTFLSSQVDPTSTSRIAAQIITGIGFLGAGVILKGEIMGKTKSEIQRSSSFVLNLTTAASIWYSAAIGMAIGYNYHFVALVSIAFVVLISRLPRIRKVDISNDQ
jgi:putative Mg2+ transporter-C (MgtC) family protein